MSDTKKEPPKFSSLSEVALYIEAHSAFFNNNESSPFSLSVNKGDFEDVLVVTGPNSSGKSLISRMFESYSRASLDSAYVSISIRERTGSGFDPNAGMKKVFMFGDEHDSSTGAISANVVSKGFLNVTNPDRSDSQVLLLDEPELGLSDGYCAAMGQLLAEHIIEAKKSTCFKGVLIVTHNKSLIKALVKFLGVPTFLSTNPKVTSIEEYLKFEEVYSADDLRSLPTKSRESWLAVGKLLNRK